jgi:hypothetical protein
VVFREMQLSLLAFHHPNAKVNELGHSPTLMRIASLQEMRQHRFEGFVG